jgi:hypothetical protein
MPLRFLDDRRLYTDYAHYRRTPGWAACLPGPPHRTLVYHCYWIGRLTAHHELSLSSLLTTQTDPFEVWLWLSGADIERNRAFLERRSAARLRVKTYVPADLARGTPLEGRPAHYDDVSPVDSSDVFRTLVLARYGGVYFDLDVLFLKDVRPLTGVEFFYAWSNQPYGNSALAHYHQGSRNVRALLRRGASLGTFFPRQLSRYDQLSPVVDELYVLPSFAVDPTWIAHDTGRPINDYCNRFDDFFQRDVPMTMRDFFPGSYSYHWHNHWDVPLLPGSIAGQLYRELCPS